MFYLYINQLFIADDKGQIKPKTDWRAVDSPKKRTNEFGCFGFLLFAAKKLNLFLWFFGESTAPQSAFGFFWPLICYQTQNLCLSCLWPSNSSTLQCLPKEPNLAEIWLLRPVWSSFRISLSAMNKVEFIINLTKTMWKDHTANIYIENTMKPLIVVWSAMKLLL